MKKQKKTFQKKPRKKRKYQKNLIKNQNDKQKNEDQMIIVNYQKCGEKKKRKGKKLKEN